MNFASALFSLRRGHKIRRKHWIGYWELGEDSEVYMYCHDGKNLNIRESEDILYTFQKIWLVMIGRLQTITEQQKKSKKKADNKNALCDSRIGNEAITVCGHIQKGTA